MDEEYTRRHAYPRDRSRLLSFRSVATEPNRTATERPMEEVWLRNGALLLLLVLVVVVVTHTQQKEPMPTVLRRPSIRRLVGRLVLVWVRGRSERRAAHTGAGLCWVVLLLLLLLLLFANSYHRQSVRVSSLLISLLGPVTITVTPVSMRETWLLLLQTSRPAVSTHGSAAVPYFSIQSNDTFSSAPSGSRIVLAAGLSSGGSYLCRFCSAVRALREMRQVAGGRDMMNHDFNPRAKVLERGLTYAFNFVSTAFTDGMGGRWWSEQLLHPSDLSSPVLWSYLGG
uniref:Uncharacterized protein n=1 Tax=Anopheles farauti TaxID=69004 RepID=A0A182QQY0_9DIPT